MPASYQVIKAHRAPSPDRLRARAGECVRFERKESEWQGWIWCIDSSGEAGWAPENWVKIEGNFCTFQRDYDAFELSVDAGETVSVELVESGWAWAIAKEGQSGWIPLASLEEPVTSAPYLVADADQARMLRKLMLYWDGQWFLKTVEAFGLDAAIEINARVRHAFGRIEMRTMLKALGKSQADDLPDAMRILEAYAQVFMKKALRAEFVTLDDERAEVIIRRCAAYEGAKRAALPRQDQACIACETLWNAWLETLLPGVAVKVQYPERQGTGALACRFLIYIGEAVKPE